MMPKDLTNKRGNPASKNAFDGMTPTRRRNLYMLVLRDCARRQGSTSDETEARHNEDHQTISPRYTELRIDEGKGSQGFDCIRYMRDQQGAPMQRLTRHGKRGAIVHVLTDAGHEALVSGVIQKRSSGGPA